MPFLEEDPEPQSARLLVLNMAAGPEARNGLRKMAMVTLLPLNSFAVTVNWTASFASRGALSRGSRQRTDPH